MANKKVLIVIDMQNDFLTGALANEEGCKAIPKVKALIEAQVSQGAPVFFTRDTHFDNYLETQEGRLLPVVHCIKGTSGHEITDELKGFASDDNTIDKITFGYTDFGKYLQEKLGQEPEEIIMCGVCTDICVISNAMVLKAAFPEATIRIIADCCAGVTPESHDIALKAMAGCQFIVE